MVPLPEVLNEITYFMRDWRTDEPIRMDPRLFDLAWEVHRKVGSEEPFHVVSAYRSPGTNSMLRRRSRGVAKHSQHMLGKAMDFYLPDTPTARMRETAMRMQRGGVGFYPGAHTPFVHLDAGDVVRHALVGAIVEAYDRHTQRVMRRKEGNDRNGQRGAAL